MIVANRATLSGIIRAPFLSPAGQGYSGGIHNNIRLDLSPTQLGFGRMRYRTAQRFVQDKMTALGQTRHFNYAPTTSDLPDTPRASIYRRYVPSGMARLPPLGAGVY